MLSRHAYLSRINQPIVVLLLMHFIYLSKFLICFQMTGRRRSDFDQLILEFYDPDDPGNAVLEPGASAANYVEIASGILVLGVILLMWNLIYKDEVD